MSEQRKGVWVICKIQDGTNALILGGTDDDLEVPFPGFFSPEEASDFLKELDKAGQLTSSLMIMPLHLAVNANQAWAWRCRDMKAALEQRTAEFAKVAEELQAMPADYADRVKDALKEAE